MGSKENSARRARSRTSGSTCSPSAAAASSRATSVGSPCSSLLGVPSSALLHATITRLSWCSGPPSTTHASDSGTHSPPVVQIRDDVHAVLGERPRLVGADHVGRAEGLDRAQPLDDRAASHQNPRPEGQRERDDGEETFGNEAGDQPDREDHRLGERQTGAERRERQERETHHDGDDRDQPGDATDLMFERTLFGLDALGQRRDTPQLGPHSGREHQRVSFAAWCRSCR